MEIPGNGFSVENLAISPKERHLGTQGKILRNTPRKMQTKTDLREFSVRMQESTWICQYAARASGHWKQNNRLEISCLFFGAAQHEPLASAGHKTPQMHYPMFSEVQEANKPSRLRNTFCTG